MTKKKTLFPNQGLDDFILGQPDILKANSARRVHEIQEQLANMKRPIDETNERLADIEGHSGKMSELLMEAAISNEKGTRLALRVGITAIIIAVLMPAVQIGYNEFWRTPNEAQATQAIITDLKAEIVDLKQQQALALEGLSGAIAGNEKDTVTVLESIKEVLERPSGGSVEQKNSE